MNSSNNTRMTKNIGSNLISQVEGNELKGPRASYSNMKNCYPCCENQGLDAHNISHNGGRYAPS